MVCTFAPFVYNSSGKLRLYYYYFLILRASVLICFVIVDDEKKLNATYIISVARKLGCTVFLLPEDIMEVPQLTSIWSDKEHAVTCDFPFVVPGKSKDDPHSYCKHHVLESAEARTLRRRWRSRARRSSSRGRGGRGGGRRRGGGGRKYLRWPLQSHHLRTMSHSKQRWFYSRDSKRKASE